MGIFNLFAPVARPVALWESTSKNLVMDGLLAAQRAQNEKTRKDWRKLHGFLDGLHYEYVRVAAKVSHPERSREWNEGDGAGYRYFQLIQMLVSRLAVAFHRPPETYLHRGDGEPLPDDDPQMAQWRQDAEDIELDEVLRQAEEWATCMGQSIVSPSWLDGRMAWLVLAPYELYVHQSRVDPSSLELAETISVEIRQPVDSAGGQQPTLYSSWVRRELEDGGIAWEHWVHDEGGRLAPNPLFVDPTNGYGMHPHVLWRIRRPAGGLLFLPPNEAWIQQQLGVDVAVTDLHYGLRYTAHPQWVQQGMPVDEASPTLGPGRLIKFAGPEGDLKAVTPELNISESRATIEWDLRMMAVAESLPPDIFAPNAARNLAALQEQRHDLMLRRERVVPIFQRALRRTFRIHRAVANYWQARGADRVRYDDALQLGVRLAPIPQVQDRWQDAQATQVEIALGLASAVERVMDREGVDRAEAERRVLRRIEESQLLEREGLPEGAAPGPATAGGGEKRPASVERG